MRQIDFGGIRHLLGGLLATHHSDRLRPMVGLLAARASGPAGLRPATILRLRQFVARVIDYIPLRTNCLDGGLKLCKFLRDHDESDQQKAFH